MSSLARSTAAALAGLSVWIVASSAAAQEDKALGQKQSFVLSLEHLGGYSNRRVEFDGGDPITNHQFGFFTPFLGPYGTHARLGFHYFVAPPISVGALASYSDNDDLGTFTLIGARVGAAIPMSGSTSIWLRGGIAYSRTTLEFGDNTQTFSAFVPGGEVLFALKPLDHFGFLVGGMFETTVGATATSEETGQPDEERDYQVREIALTLGVFLEL